MKYLFLWKYFLFNVLILENTSAFSSVNTKSVSSKVNLREEKTYSFSVPLENARPKPNDFVSTFIELWNDPRPVTSLIKTDDRSFVGERQNENGKMEEIPYCIISDKFEIGNEDEYFQILLYPRGRFVRDYSSVNGIITGPASAYLRYLPKRFGDEIDIAYKLRLVHDVVNESGDVESKPLGVITSGGLPRSKDTWSSAMTFCTEMEAVESVGRATDWGSSSWLATDVVNALGNIRAEGEMTIFEKRQGEISLLARGALGSVRKAVLESSKSYSGNNDEEDIQNYEREFRVGEVIVPTSVASNEKETEFLKKSFIYPGVDYRIMTMSDKDGNPIFSTNELDLEERREARLALRPCGWKLQSQLWQKNGMKTDWPVEVNAGRLSSISLTRFNVGSAIPRVVAAFQRDWVAYTFALLVAITPIPAALLARNVVSFYAIPSASMDPTLQKGDLLLVEKLPGVFDRTKRGDIILFKPPQSLQEIVTSSGSSISSTSLFVKRVVGLPGDTGIQLSGDDGEVIINGDPAVGPNRSLCADEPLRLIDKFLEKGKGKEIESLGSKDLYVLGDCKAVSVDSRVFGVLPKENLAGKPIARIWPLERLKIGEL